MEIVLGVIGVLLFICAAICILIVLGNVFVAILAAVHAGGKKTNLHMRKNRGISVVKWILAVAGAGLVTSAIFSLMGLIGSSDLPDERPDSVLGIGIFGWLVILVLGIGLIILARVVRKRIDVDKDPYPVPRRGWNLTASDAAQRIESVSGDWETEDRACLYARGTMRVLRDFAWEYEPASIKCQGWLIERRSDATRHTGCTRSYRVDLVNTSSYSTFDVIMFAARLGWKRIADESTAQRYLLYMTAVAREVTFFGEDDSVKEYLKSRQFLHPTMEQTIRETARILCYDCEPISDDNKSGWEVPTPEEKDVIDENMWHHAINTVNLLYAKIDNLFDDILKK